MSATAVMAVDISVLMETVDKTQRNDSFKPTIIKDNTVEPTNKCGENVFYSFNSENGLLTIEGTGAMYDYDEENPGPFSGDGSILSVEIAQGVTSVGKYAFYSCKSLKDVYICNSVQQIGFSAFSECSSLKSITLPFTGGDKFSNLKTHFGYIFGALNYNENDIYVPSSLKTVTVTFAENVNDYDFYSCKWLTNVTFTDNVKIIGQSAFEDCTSLKEVILPDSVEKIMNGAFYNCSNLETINLPDNILIIESDAFSGTEIYNSPEYRNNGVLYIGSCLIEANADISGTYAIKDSTKCIAQNAFSACSNLENIVIPQSVRHIGKNAFSGTAFYGNISNWENGILYIDNFLVKCSDDYSGVCNIKNNTACICDEAFSGCKFVEEINIPENLLYVGYNTFDSCESLAKINVDEANGVYYSDSYGVLFNKGKTQLLRFPSLSPITEYSVPNSVEAIFEGAFEDCKNLSEAVVPESVLYIGKGAFYGCSAIKSMTLPFVGRQLNSLSNTFFGVIFGANNHVNNKYFVPDSLKAVTVVTHDQIAPNAFYGCSKIISLTIQGNVSSIGENAFYGCSSLEVLSVPFVSSEKNNGSNAFLGYFFGSGSYLSNGLNVPSSLKTVDVTCAETISDYAFYGCQNITNISIHNGAKSIGKCSFKECKALNEIFIAYSVESIGDNAFESCESLRSLSLSNCIESVGKNIMLKCDSIQEITVPFLGSCKDDETNDFLGYYFGAANRNYNEKFIPESLLSVTVTGDDIIDEKAFYSCKTIKQVNLTGNEINIEAYAFAKCEGLTNLTVKSTKAVLSRSCFSECVSLKNVILPIDTENLPFGVFEGCTSLENINLPNKLKNIGENSFYGCSNLKCVLIPDSVVEIDENAFAYCENLEAVTFGKNMQFLGDGAFFGCLKLEKYIVNKDNNYYYAGDDGVLMNRDKSLLISYPSGNQSEIYKIPDSVVNVEDSAFRGNTKLSQITLSESMTFVGDNLFEGCEGLTCVNISANINSIGNFAFAYCTNLERIVMSDNILKIGQNAFYETAYYNNKANWEDSTGLYIGKYFIESDSSAMGTFNIKEGTECIADKAFYNSTRITKIYMPQSVHRIGDNILGTYTDMTIKCYNNTAAYKYAVSNNIPVDVVELSGTYYLITFNPNGGTLLNDTVLAEKRSNLSTLPVPTRVGYTFEGWYTTSTFTKKVTTSTVIRASVTYYAKWVAEGVTVSFDPMGGRTQYETLVVEKGNALELLPEAEKEGFVFDGWYTAKDGGEVYNVETMVENNITLYAHWTAEKYKVTFLSNTNDIPSTEIEVEYNDSVRELPSLMKQGSVFLGWYTLVEGGEKVTCETVIKKDTVFYAHWSNEPKYVYSVSIDDVKMNYGSSYVLKPEIKCDDGTNYIVKYESLDTDVAVVDNNGKVTTRSNGSSIIVCTVTDSYGNTVKGMCKVTVKYTLIQMIVMLFLFGWIWN